MHFISLLSVLALFDMKIVMAAQRSRNEKEKNKKKIKHEKMNPAVAGY